MCICVSPNRVSVIRSRWLEGNHLSCPVFECGGSEWVWRDKQTTRSLTKREGWKRVCGYSFKIVRYSVCVWYACVCVQLGMYASPRYVTIPTPPTHPPTTHPTQRYVCTDESPKTRCVYSWVRFVCADEAFDRWVKSVCADESPPFSHPSPHPKPQSPPQSPPHSPPS